MNSSVVAIISASLASLTLAPVIGTACRWLGIVDKPDGHRKLHSHAVPLTGGPTVLLSIVVSIAITTYAFPGLLSASEGDVRFLLSLAGAAIVIVFVGMLDDRFGLRGRQKLAGQFLAALIMVPSGILIRRIELFGYPIEFGDVAPFVTVFWILGAVNALNLIDGVDGLASTTGIILSLSVAAVTYILGGRPDGLLISLALAGALAGFLFYNFPPARMFLGDSGSMLIGLVLGSVALKCSLKQYAAVALVMPTAIWAIPIFDVAMAILRRRLTGRSIYTVDRGHLHHCLVRHGHSGGRLLLIVGSLCSLTGLGAIAAAAFNSEMLAVIAVATALTLLVLTRSFGHAELNLLTNRVRRFAASLIRKGVDPNPVLHDEQVRLHGRHKWEHLWETLTQFAEKHDLAGVELMVNMPSLGEAYHATWRTRTRVEQHDAWRSDIPLVIEGIRAGHVRLVGVAPADSFCDCMNRMMDGMKPFEQQLREIVCHLRSQRMNANGTLRDSGGPFRLPVIPEEVGA